MLLVDDQVIVVNPTRINLKYPKLTWKKNNSIMSLSTVIKTGLSILLDNPIIVEGAPKKALAIIKEHFTYSSE